jgi:hypothetical protein
MSWIITRGFKSNLIITRGYGLLINFRDAIINVVRKRSQIFTSEIKKTDVMAKQKKKDILYDARRGGSR